MIKRKEGALKVFVAVRLAQCKRELNEWLSSHAHARKTKVYKMSFYPIISTLSNTNLKRALQAYFSIF